MQDQPPSPPALPLPGPGRRSPTGPKTRTPQRRRARVWLALIGLTLSLPFVAGQLFRVSQDRACRQLETSARARREPLTLDEIARQHPALDPLTNPAAAFIELWKTRDSDYWSALERGIRPASPQRKDPADPDLPYATGRDRLNVPRASSIPASMLVPARQTFQSQASRRTAIRRALERGPVARYPVQITDGLAALLPHLPALQEEARFLRLGVLVAIDDGNPEAALDELETILQLSRSLAAEPFLITHLVRIRIHHWILDDLERLLSRRPLPIPLRDRASRLVLGLSMGPAEQVALMTERAVTLQAIDDPTLADSDSLTREEKDLVSKAMKLGQIFGYLSSERRLALDTFDRALALQSLPTADRLRESKVLFDQFQLKARRFPPKILCGLIIPALARIPSRFASLEARQEAALAALAIEELRNRPPYRLPEDLSTLRRTDGPPAPPLDPFDGRTLRVKTLNPGYVVYSVGEDQVDDGGRERSEGGPHAGTDVTFIIER